MQRRGPVGDAEGLTSLDANQIDAQVLPQFTDADG
jgi:hypothetical protein